VLGENDVPNIADFSVPAGRYELMRKNTKRPARGVQRDTSDKPTEPRPPKG